MQNIPALAARDVLVLDPKSHPVKTGFSHKEGQARALHDLASIELQAMEMALRTLCEFPSSPLKFREELKNVCLSEAEHLRICLLELEKMGYEWGHWPVHQALWSALDSTDSLLDRILIVHRYLEGSGLDAGDTLLRRLAGCVDFGLQAVLQKITEEEISHVEFGCRWYRLICESEGLDSQVDFEQRMKKLRERLPKRIEKISFQLRLRAGFTTTEINFLEEYRKSYLSKSR